MNPPAERQIADLVAALGAARAAMEQGAFVDLADLEAPVIGAMEAAKAAPAADRPALMAGLKHLMEELEKLSNELIRQQRSAAQARAAAAYGGEK
jgi:hypothetical protein